ncbi:carboxypeptidase regulatory-like domain-containing protein, partial [bacterium]|nr:carboxypeptidase regulatory-like domain-containing protein [bacterium]
MKKQITFLTTLILLCFAITDLSFAGGALHFERNQREWVEIEDSESLDIDGQNITMEAWIRCPNPNTNDELTIWNKENSYEAHIRNGLFQVAIFTDSWAWLGDDTRIQADEWTHVAGTYDGQNIRLYINGDLRSTHGKRGNIRDVDTSFFIGVRPLSDFIHCYNGDVDELRVWNITRTADEINEFMNIMLSGDEEGLVGYWRFDEGDGQILHDYTQFENHGTLGDDEDEDARDPEWIESEAPVYGGEIVISRNAVNFSPIPSGQNREETFLITNITEEDDDAYTVDFIFEYQGRQPEWLEVEPMEGQVEPRNETNIVFSVSTGDLEQGEYNHDVLLSCNAMNLNFAEIPVTMTIVEGVGHLYGVVTDPSDNDSPIEGTLVQVVADFDMQQTTNENGEYDFGETPAWTYDLLVTAPDYLPMTEENIEVEPDGEVEVNFSLLHSICSPNPDAI